MPGPLPPVSPNGSVHRCDSVSVYRAITGAEYLYQAKDDSEMHQWVSSLDETCAALGGASAGQSSKTLPAASSEAEPKKRSFFTLKKK